MPVYAIPAHEFGPAFDSAVETARQNTPIQYAMVDPRYRAGYRIVRKVSPYTTEATFHVFHESAWTPPTEQPLLPWSPPTGEVVATVSLDGVVVLR